MNDSLDYAERDGFQTGKAAAIAEWRFRKDKASFAVLVNRLRVRKWQKENGDKKREKGRKWAAAHAAEVYAKQKKRWRDKARARGEVYACKECGASWCPVPWARGKQGRAEFCGSTCYQRWRYRNDAEYRERQKARQRGLAAARRP